MAWIPTISVSQIGEENLASAKAGKLWVTLYRLDSSVFATSAICSHGQASLADGFLENGEIECPLHQGAFDVRTGKPTRAPCTVPIRCFPCRLEGDLIYVEVSDSEV